MEKVKIYVETKGVGDAVCDELEDILAKDNMLFKLTTLKRIPANSVISITTRKGKVK